jgi:hypothetical protein
MPGKECHVEDERMRFVIRLKDGEKMAGLCKEFGISRKTGYKIFARFEKAKLSRHRSYRRIHAPRGWEQQKWDHSIDDPDRSAGCAERQQLRENVGSRAVDGQVGEHGGAENCRGDQRPPAKNNCGSTRSRDGSHGTHLTQSLQLDTRL